MHLTPVSFWRIDRVHADRGLADLAVADDQFPLSAADRRHGIDGLEARIHGLIDGLALDDARGDHFDAAEFGGLDGSLAVDRLACPVDDAPEDRLAHRNLRDSSRPLDDVAFLDMGDFAEDGDTDVVRFEVEDHAQDAAGEFQKLHGHRVLDTVDAGDAVTDGEDCAGFADIELLLVILDLLGYDLTDFLCPDRLHALSLLP